MDSPRGDSPAGSDHEPRGSSSSENDPKTLPDDLPKSLDDRRSFPAIQQETEMYDAWQGSQILSFVPPPAAPPFSLLASLSVTLAAVKGVFSAAGGSMELRMISG